MEKKNVRQLSGRKSSRGCDTRSQSEYKLMGYSQSLESAYIRTGRESATMINVPSFKQDTQRGRLNDREQE